MAADPPYPELKKTHTMAHKGRPWRDYKPPPSGPVWNIIQAGNSYWMLVAAIDLGVFDALADLKKADVKALADRLDASPPHLLHLLDAMVTFGFLDQVDDVFELTETAERYLCTDGPASMAALVRVSPGPLENWTQLASMIREGRVAQPIEEDMAGFYGPLVQATFPTQHRAASRLGLKLGWARRPGLRVLDLGAGRAPWAIAVLEQSEGSSATINDIPEITPLAEATIAERGLEGRADYLPGDFHDIELPTAAYDIVALGHLCRTEGADLAPRLIARAVAALKPGGHLLLADYFADNDRKMNPFGVQMGLTMLANTRHGQTLTHEQVHGWLANEPLENIRLVEPIGFNLVYVASKRREERKP
ncbi:MAG: methyltransferase dimerization domain-containing protein [Pseudomonadota bacterium]